MVNHKRMHTGKGRGNQYIKLLVMTVLSFMAMYVLMYAMVNTFANVFSNVNQFYMAGLMTMPMIIIELSLMGAMYMNKKLNVLLIVGSLIALIAFFVCIRQQTAVSDTQFLESMIPHHGAAILMCKEASIHDPQVEELCRSIIKNQQSEIDLMKAKLSELEKN